MARQVGVYHCFARSGGTLVNRLLAASQGVRVLSEVGPAASVRDPLEQAVVWLGLVDVSDATGLQALGFGALMAELVGRTASRGEQLILRDFCTPNFLARAYGEVLPSGQMEIGVALEAAGLAPVHAVVARRSAAVYVSLVRSFPHLADLTIDEFSVAYHGFARAAAPHPVVRYEDLVADPREQLARLCELLGCPFDPEALTAFASFDQCTGDMHLASPSRGGSADRVTQLTDPTDDARYLAAAAHPLCRAADDLFGFEPIGDAAPAATAIAAYEAALGRTQRQLVAIDSARRDALSHLAVSAAEADRLATEAEHLRRTWDETCGELARAEAVAADRLRQLGLLMAELERPTERAERS